MADSVDVPKSEKNEKIEKNISSTSTNASVDEGKEQMKGNQTVDEAKIGVASPPIFSVAKIVHDEKAFTPRFGHCVAELNGSVYIYGGIDRTGEVIGNLIKFVPENNTFSLVATSSVKPGPLTGSTLVSMVNHKTSQKILCLFGGSDNHSTEMDSTWMFNPDSNEWKNLPNAGTYPTARKEHCCVVSDKTNCLYVWGGFNLLDTVLNDGYCLSKSTWSKMRGCDAENSPTGRCNHSGILHFDSAKGREYLYIFGGDLSGRGAGTNQLWKYDLTSAKWTLLDNVLGEQPSPRWSHSATLFDNRMWITGGQYGGWFSNYCFSDFYVFDIPANCWFNCNLSSKDFGYHAHFGSMCLVSSNKAFYVFGGLNYSGEAISDVYNLAPVCTTANLAGVTTEMLKCKSQVKAALQIVDTLQESISKEEVEKMYDEFGSVLKRVATLEKTIEEMKVTIQDLLKSGGKVETTKQTAKTDTKNPAEPTKPAETTKPAEKADPTKLAEKAEPTKPAEKAEPTKPAEKAEPTKPAEKAEPTKPAEKAELTKPAEKAEPTKPAEKIEPTKQTGKAEPTKQTGKAEPTKQTGKAEIRRHDSKKR